MSESLKKQREGYLAQLQQVDSQLNQMKQKESQLQTQREQLKGAIFALDTLSQTQETELSKKDEETKEEGEK